MMKRTRKRKLLAISVATIAAFTAVIVPIHTCGGNKTNIFEDTSKSIIISDDSQAQVETSEPEEVYENLTMFTTCTVHLRESDSKESKSLKILPASSIVTAQVIEGADWYAVSYKGTKGYIYSEYLHEYNPEIHLEIGLDYVHQDLVREMIEVLQLDVDEYFFYGMMYTENRFQNEPESEAGAQGILQIMPSTWKMLYAEFNEKYPDYSHLIINDPTDKTSNIILGMYCISHIQHCYGFKSVSNNAHVILTSYNRGIAGAEDYYKTYGTYESSYSQEILRAADHIREHKTWKEGL